MLSKESCSAVLNAGSNLRVSGLPTSDLIELAPIARQRGVRLEIKCGLSPDSMVEIAEAGGENVSFGCFGLRLAISRHCVRHGTRSSCNTSRRAITSH